MDPATLKTISIASSAGGERSAEIAPGTGYAAFMIVARGSEGRKGREGRGKEGRRGVRKGEEG